MTEVFTGNDETLSMCAAKAWSEVISSLGKVKRTLPDSTVNIILPHALSLMEKKPFADVRISTYTLLRSLLVFPATCTLVCTQHRDHIVNFESEENYPAKVAKHNFVCSLIITYPDVVKQLLGKHDVEVLTVYSNTGPFYKPTEEIQKIEDVAA